MARRSAPYVPPPAPERPPFRKFACYSCSQCLTIDWSKPDSDSEPYAESMGQCKECAGATMTRVSPPITCKWHWHCDKPSVPGTLFCSDHPDGKPTQREVYDPACIACGMYHVPPAEMRACHEKRIRELKQANRLLAKTIADASCRLRAV